jgi:fucose permease
MERFKESKVLLLISLCSYPIYLVLAVRAGTDLLLSMFSSVVGAFATYIAFGMLYELQREHGIFNPLIRWLKR